MLVFFLGETVLCDLPLQAGEALDAVGVVDDEAAVVYLYPEIAGLVVVEAPDIPFDLLPRDAPRCLDVDACVYLLRDLRLTFHLLIIPLVEALLVMVCHGEDTLTAADKLLEFLVLSRQAVDFLPGNMVDRCSQHLFAHRHIEHVGISVEPAAHGIASSAIADLVVELFDALTIDGIGIVEMSLAGVRYSVEMDRAHLKCGTIVGNNSILRLIHSPSYHLILL